MSWLRLVRSRTRSIVSVSAWIVADRGEPSRSLISPKNSPGPMRFRSCSTLPLTTLETSTVPWQIRNISSPGSPSRKSTWFFRRGGLEDRRPLGVGELVLGQEGVGRPLQLSKEVRIDHRPSDEILESVRHIEGSYPF